MIRIFLLSLLLFAAPTWAADVLDTKVLAALPNLANPAPNLVTAGALQAKDIPVSASSATTTKPAAEPAGTLEFPRIEGAGGVYRLPAGVDMPAVDAVHRVLIDAHEGETMANGISRHLEVAARAVNLYALAKVPPENLKVAVVVHGKATPLVLTDASYRRQFGKPNPNAALLTQLRQSGVELYVCGQALSHQGYVVADVHDDVRVSLSAMTKLVELQAAGYALIP